MPSSSPVIPRSFSRADDDSTVRASDDVRRNAALDGIRAVAVCAVMLTHTWVEVFMGGWVGVDVFFVLSGFLITGLLLAEHQASGAISFRGFYRRRAVRLFPPLFVMLAVVTTTAVLIRPALAVATGRTALWTALDAANWAGAAHQPTGLLSHMWSLSIEEQFYFTWPVLLIAMLRWRTARFALMVTMACIVAIVAHRTLLAQTIDLRDQSLYQRTDTRADSLLVGCALSLAADLGWSLSPQFWRIAAMVSAAYIVVLLPTSYNTGAWNYSIGFTVLALAAASVIGAVAVHPWPPLVRILSWGPMAHLGRISYAVYLWHLPIAMLLPIGHGLALTVGTFVVSVAVAEVSMRVIERPARRWRGDAAHLARHQCQLLADT